MDKLYSKTALLAKAVGCFMLTPLFFAMISALNSGYILLYFVILAVPIGCVYTIPFCLSVSNMRKYRVNEIKKYVICDCIACYLPAVFGSLFTEVVDSVIRQSTEMAGLITIIFAVIFLMISSVFWLMYLVYSHNK